MCVRIGLALLVFELSYQFAFFCLPACTVFLGSLADQSVSEFAFVLLSGYFLECVLGIREGFRYAKLIQALSFLCTIALFLHLLT